MWVRFGIECKGLTALSLVVVLAGCSGGGSNWLVSNPDLDATEGQAMALLDNFDSLVEADGVTQEAELPAGDVTYTGLVLGAEGGGDGPDFEYVADLTLDVAFDTDGVSGTVDNFRTNLGGFTGPSGSVPVTGAVTIVAGEAELDFAGSASLTGADRIADYDLTAAGVFVGDAAESAAGFHVTDFLWQTGPDVDETSRSDGVWIVEQ